MSFVTVTVYFFLYLTVVLAEDVWFEVLRFRNCTFQWKFNICKADNLFLCTGVSGKEGTIHLASKAVMKKNANKSLSFEENTIIEPAESEDSVQTVIR